MHISSRYIIFFLHPFRFYPSSPSPTFISSPPGLRCDTANLINSVWASLSRVKSHPSRNLCIIPFKTVFLHRACMAMSPTKQGFLRGKLRSQEVSRRFWDETSHVAFIQRAKWREEEKEYQEAGWAYVCKLHVCVVCARLSWTTYQVHMYCTTYQLRWSLVISL